MTEPTSAKSNNQLVSGLVFLAGVIGVLLYAAIKLSYWLEDEQQVPVQTIEFTGQRLHIDDLQMEKLIRQHQPGSFFKLDVEQVHQLLEEQAWIYRASVRKQWPNSLKIFLVEQQPVAKWNGDMLLNQYGDSFQASLPQSNIPLLFGPGGSEQTALQGYRAMQSLLSSAGLQVEELMLSERFAWQVRLSGGIRLNLGRSEFIDRLQRFIDIYPLLLQQEKPVDYVDLRYDTGVAVGWKQPADKTEKQES